MEIIIRMDEAVFRYPEDDEDTIKHISLEIPAGSFTAVLGHNGCGKSTLAKLMNAVFLPGSGHVYIKGMDTLREDCLLSIRRTVGMVFQNPDNQIVASVVEDDVAFAPENLGVESSEIRRRVDDALRRVRMYDFRLHAPHLLSGGQKQRIAIAGVLAMQPEILVLDEPTAMLDPAGRREVLRTVEELRRDTGMTVILITHHMDECIPADRILVMDRGRIALDGAPREIFPQVETMRSLGLDVPATTETLYELNRRGLSLPLDSLTAEEFSETVFSRINSLQKD